MSAADKADEVARRCMPVSGSEWPLSEHGYAIAVGHAANVIRNEFPIALSTSDLHRIRQWFNSLEDTNPAYVDAGDRDLYRKIIDVLRARNEWK